MPQLDAKGRHTVAFTLNGRETTVEVETRTLLTDALRHGLGATGTHVGANTASAAPAPSPSTACRPGPA